MSGATSVKLLGLDVGSTTVKAVLLAPDVKEPTASAYARHQGDLVGAVRRLVRELASPDTVVRVVVTGNGGAAVAQCWGAPHVHEVSAVAHAVRTRHPAARAVVELGGQDAKLVVFDPGGRGHTSMNDRCAAGTGVTIDRCLFRLGIAPAEARLVRYDRARVRPVSAKCGVFAETDLVNLARAGVAPEDLVTSLADAIVVQNLAVLSRGLTLEPEVVLLGGPHVHLPALAQAWRSRLTGPVVVPDGALLYAAMGAAEGSRERAPLRTLAELAAALDLPFAVAPAREDRPFESTVTIAGAPPRQSVPQGPVLIGVDAGSTVCKVVATDLAGNLVSASSRRSTDPISDCRTLLAELRRDLGELDVRALGVTGYGAAALAPLLDANASVVETVAHARSARAIEPAVDVVCDVGGQDIKVVVLDRAGAIRDFRLSSQCSAGIGMILEATARELGVRLDEVASRALGARRAPWFGDACAVFLDANRVTFQRQGFTADEILAGLVRALPRVVWSQVMNGTRPASLGRVFVLAGGVQRNLAAVIAQTETLCAEVPGARIVVHPHAAEAGAIGAALCAGDRAQRPRPLPSLERLEVRVRSDEATRCRLCANGCPRSFLEVVRPGTAPLVQVVGNACSEGAEPGSPASGRRTRRTTPNLLDAEVRLFFHRRHAGAPIRRIPLRPLRIGIPRVLSLYRAAPMFRAYLAALGVPDVVFSPVTSEALWRDGACHGASDPCFPVKVTLAHVHHLIHHVHDAGRRLDALFVPHFTHAVTPVRHCVDTASCPVIAATPGLVRAAFAHDLARRGIELITPMVTVTEMNLLRRQMFEAFGALTGATEEESRQALKAGVEACAWVDRELERAAAAIFRRVSAEPRRGAVLVIGRPYHADPGLNHRVGEELTALGFPVLTVRSMPRDEAWLATLMHDELATGAIADPFDVRDLLPEAINSGVAERLFAARIAARHGKVGVVDLSSFKCGQDSPTYGPVRDLLDRAGVPVCTLHDLDETRPVTSLRVRLRTFAHAMAARGLAAS